MIDPRILSAYALRSRKCQLVYGAMDSAKAEVSIGKLSDHIAALTEERDQLRDALEQIIDTEVDEDLSLARAIAWAALDAKGK